MGATGRAVQLLLNLHTHLEGQVRPSTAAALAEELGESRTVDAWEAALQLSSPGTLTEYLAKVISSFPFFTRAEWLARITREAVEDAVADGQHYVEIRFGPSSHVGTNLSLDEAIEAVCIGFAEASRASGVQGGVIVAALRGESSVTSESVARAAARAAGAGVVGFDLAGDEALHPDLAVHATAFEIARVAGLGLTCHASEAGPAEAALEAVRKLGVSRIGHGVHAVERPDVVSRLAEEGIGIEICPTSNVYTEAIGCIEAHPASEMLQKGVRLVMGDDNPRQTGSSLSSERLVLTNVLGLSTRDIERIVQDSIDLSFADSTVKSALRTRLGSAQDLSNIR